MEDFNITSDYLYNSALGLYKDGHFNAARKAIEMIIETDSLDIIQNLFYFKVLIKIGGNLSGNDYFSNSEKAKILFNELIGNDEIKSNKELKKQFSDLLKDYEEFRGKIHDLKFGRNHF